LAGFGPATAASWLPAPAREALDERELRGSGVFYAVRVEKTSPRKRKTKSVKKSQYQATPRARRHPHGTTPTGRTLRDERKKNPPCQEAQSPSNANATTPTRSERTR
jgi:hypothetical protein